MLERVWQIGILLALTAAIHRPPVVHAQGRRVTPYIRLDESTGYGGYDYDHRGSSGWSFGADVTVHRLGRGELLLGGGYSWTVASGNLAAICHDAVRRPCVLPFPHFSSANADIGWRHRVGRVGTLDLLLQPTLFNPHGSNAWIFGPSAAINASHPLWKSASILVSSGGSYIPSFQGQRLGFHHLAVGLRLW